MDVVHASAPGDDPDVELDHGRFPYAGKLTTRDVGLILGRDRGEVVAAASYSIDRTDEDRCVIRYIAVRRDRQGEGLGTELLAATPGILFDRRFDSIKMAARSPYALVAAVRAGFCVIEERAPDGSPFVSYPPTTASGSLESGFTALQKLSLTADHREYIADRLTDLATKETSEITDE